MKRELNDLRQQFIEAAGNATQTFGAGRAMGQVFAHVYFSRDPQSLDDLTEHLGISKGSASMVVRQLEGWGALKRVWIKGERKDYYQATEEFGRVIRRALLDMIGHKIESFDRLLEEGHKVLAHGASGANEDEFLRERVAKLQAFRDRARRVWDSSILALLLK